MLNLVIILLIILCLLIYIYKHKYIKLQKYENLQNNLQSITNIMNFTKQISIYRPVESSNLRKVKDIVINEMKKYIDVSEQSFDRTIRNKTYKFSNLIGVNIKAKPPYILLGAHIDSPQIENCESTIDACTSISIILELVKNLLKNNPNYPLMILFIDGEEALGGSWSNDNTLSGSRYFVNNYDLNLIDKTYIFDLIGGDININKISCFRNNIESKNDFDKLYNINLKYNKQIFVNPNEFISDIIITDDHTPFMEKNKYSVNLIPYKFPSSHHTLNDNYNNVNWEYVDIFYKVLYDFIYEY